MKLQSHGFNFQTRYEAEANKARVIGLWERWQDDAEIARGQEFSLRFWSHGGTVTIGTRAHTRRAWDADLPSMTGRIVERTRGGVTRAIDDRTGISTTIARTNIGGSMTWPGDTWGTWDDGGVVDPVPPIPQPPGGGGGGTTHVAVRIKLFAPGITDPVQVWELDQGLAGNVRYVAYDPPGFPTPDAPIKRAGWWRCTVTPIQDITEIYLSADCAFGRVPFRQSQISARLFRNLFRVAFEVLVPDARIEGSKIKVTAARELAAAFGEPPFTDEKDISPATGNAEMKSIDITAVSGRQLKDYAASRHDHRNIAAQGPIADDDVAIRIQAGFTDTTLSVVGIDVARLDGDFGQVFIHIPRQFNFLNAVPYMAIDFSTLGTYALPFVNVFKEVNRASVDTAIMAAVNGNASMILRYMREGLGRAMSPTGVVDQIWWSNNAIDLRYFVEPPMPATDAHWYLPDEGGGIVHPGGFSDGDLATSVTTDGGGSGTSGGGGGSGSSPSTLGVFPTGFVVDTANKALELLDRHDMLVFIMMENRSFDHLLGGLASARPRGVNDPNRYEGPPAGSTNPMTDGFDVVPVVATTAINMGTVTPICPNHSYEPTGFQIRDGVHELKDDDNNQLGLSGMMQGFTRNVAYRTDSPQIVMMQYQEEQLPTYYALADDFKVCDRWFAAHPGPTWPNRYATVCGHIPAVDNFEIDDPRIGFLRDHTIWDALTSAGIDWRVYESDLSLVRTFDRYRLDDTHVVRFDDPIDGFEAMLRSQAPMPRAVFVEPNFTDLPPVAKACDDLAPADLAHGQAFIRRVYDLIRLSGKSSRIMLVITYDEHGGFWDHVPPPGTAKAATLFPEYANGAVPQLIENGPKHLGVRVPGFVVSPFVGAGQVCHTVFDHTSILKTILVHNRQRLNTDDFAQFGPRVAKAHHLGVALDELEQARTWPPLIARDPGRSLPSDPRTAISDTAGGIVAPPTAVSDGGGGPGGSWTAPAPVVINSTGVGRQPDDRGDFHSGLRDMLRPHR